MWMREPGLAFHVRTGARATAVKNPEERWFGVREERAMMLAPAPGGMVPWYIPTYHI